MALITCSECGKEVSDKADKCPNCGAPVEKITLESVNIPVKRRKGFMYYASIFCFIVVAIAFIAVQSESKEPKQSKIQKATGTTTEQAEGIEKILEKCDIQRIDSVKADEILNDTYAKGEKGYRISADGIDNIILYLKKDNKVNIVRYADNNLYTKGKVVSKLSDYTFTSREESDIQIKCQNAVKEILKSPSTAKFPNILKWGFSKNKGEITVQSYVDSQNSFGATIRSEFQFIITKDDQVKSFIFDGEELMNK